MKIRRAVTEDAKRLSELAWSAKAHWDYPSQTMELWRDELSVTQSDIRRNPTFVAETDNEVAGFYLLDVSKSEWCLEHLWVAPSHMTRGIGSALLAHALETARCGGATEIMVDADPNAEPFYLARGGVRCGYVAAPIPGEPARRRPQLVFNTIQQGAPADHPTAAHSTGG